MLRKSLIITGILIVLLVSSNSYAITGLGFGVRGGYVMGLDLGPVDDFLGTAVPNAEADDKMPMIGAHIKVGTLPVIDFDIALEYAWKDMDLGNGYGLKIGDFSISATGIYKVMAGPMITPYVGVGAGSHKLSYTFDQPGGGFIIPGPDDETKLGYHGMVGAKIHPPMFPLEFFARYRYTIISTSDKSTKYSTIFAGATFNLP
ncbi:MAG: porin family protein [candidate division Zixibacteria bacterium]|nr:porin family protein [candidate division Zixibacteria bacterium]